MLRGQLTGSFVAPACEGTQAAIVAGIGHAMGDGVQVINMSLQGGAGDFVCPAAMGDAITAAFNAGIDVVVAAGNSGQDDGARLRWPASCARVVSVGNVDNNRLYAAGGRGSSFAPGVSISAPGEVITSTMTGFDRSIRCSDGTGANNACSVAPGQVREHVWPLGIARRQPGWQSRRIKLGYVSPGRLRFG